MKLLSIRQQVILYIHSVIAGVSGAFGAIMYKIPDLFFYGNEFVMGIHKEVAIGIWVVTAISIISGIILIIKYYREYEHKKFNNMM